jgi:hypothetical protein
VPLTGVEQAGRESARKPDREHEPSSGPARTRPAEVVAFLRSARNSVLEYRNAEGCPSLQYEMKLQVRGLAMQRDESWWNRDWRSSIRDNM